MTGKLPDEAHCDTRGRIYIKHALRARYGERFVLVGVADGVMLMPLPSDPLKDMARLGMGIRSRSLDDLKKMIHQQAEEELGE